MCMAKRDLLNNDLRFNSRLIIEERITALVREISPCNCIVARSDIKFCKK